MKDMKDMKDMKGRQYMKDMKDNQGIPPKFQQILDTLAWAVLLSSLLTAALMLICVGAATVYIARWL